MKTFKMKIPDEEEVKIKREEMLTEKPNLFENTEK